MPDTTVKFFNSTMSGAPSLTGQVGTLIGVLDACLKDGFGSVTLDSLIVAGNVATATVSAGHNLAMLGAAGPVVTIAGATPSGLNGEWRIASVPTSTTFTFATTGISDQTATGTITAKRAPLGFSKVYSGTNKAVYRADDVSSTRFYLRVDDATNAQWGYLRGYESMSDVDTGSGLFPSSGEVYAYKSSAASATARAWTLIGDSQAFYLFEQSDGTNWPGSVFFGDFVSYKSGDGYRAAILAHSATSGASNSLVTLQAADLAGHFLARAYTQLGGAIQFSKLSHARMTSLGNNSTMVHPDAVTNGTLAAPVEIWEAAGVYPRGLLPGLYCPLHHYNAAGLAQGTVIDAVTGLAADRSLWIQAAHSNNLYRAALDLTGPWR
jgi:hypothetical protein